MSVARRLMIPAAGIAAALLLAGCAGNGGGGERSWEDSPLSEYMSSAWGGDDDRTPEEMQSEFDDQNREIEEAVADCMAEEGFEYVPVLDNGSTVVTSDDEDEWDPDSRDWVAQYGYGFVNYPGRDDAPSEDEVFEDPNQEYLESLSESEQTAYNEALHGPMPTEEEYAEMEESGEMPEYDWTTAGCYGAASNAVYGDDPGSSDEHQPLMDAMSAMWEDAQGHPDMADLDAAWASCMADAGHSGFSTQQDAQQSIMDEQNAAWENQEVPEDGEWVEPDFTELGEREIEVALADFDCRDELDYADKQLDVQFELEERFIEEHKAELDAYLADMEQNRP